MEPFPELSGSVMRNYQVEVTHRVAKVEGGTDWTALGWANVLTGQPPMEAEF